MNDSQRTTKAPDAFRTISEVSEALDLPQHVLRFWESKFPQVKPLKRAGGRRYYRPDDIDLLRGIRELLHGEGLTIKGVQKVLREQGMRQVAGIGRQGLNDSPARREPEVPPPQPALPTAEQVNLSAEMPSDILLAEQRARLESVLDELLSLREILRRRPQLSAHKVSAAG